MPKPMRPVSRQFSQTAKWLHWLGAFFMLSLITWAWQFPFMAAADRAEGIPVHVSIGLLVVAITILRLSWRRVRVPPEIDPRSPGWVRLGAWLGHRLLYALILFQGIVGTWLAAISRVDIRFFNGFDISALAPANAGLADLLRPVHLAGAVVMSAVIFGHVCGALWHHFVLRDDTFIRMVPFGGLWQRLGAPLRAQQARFPSLRFSNWPKRLNGKELG